MKRRKATDARKAVIRQLAAAYDRFAEMEQLLIIQGRYAEAQGAHEYAMWVLRAYKAEIDDPKEPAWQR